MFLAVSGFRFIYSRGVTTANFREFLLKNGREASVETSEIEFRNSLDTL